MKNKPISLLIIFVALFLIAADGKVRGHMLPLDSEISAYPIHLECGAVIIEHWEDAGVDYDMVNYLCSVTLRNFFEFVQDEGFEPEEKPFYYTFSFIPDDRKYRGLNDVEYRFHRRNFRDKYLAGYVSMDLNHGWITTDCAYEYHYEAIAHEFFHAMSDYYGFFESHPGGPFDKVDMDEVLVRQFVRRYLDDIYAKQKVPSCK